MGTGASADASAPKLEVQGTATLVVEIGKDGQAVTRGSDLPIEKVTQIFVVIDPRAGYVHDQVEFLKDPKVLRTVMRGGGGKTNLKVFVLVPSITSSKAHLMNAHMALMFLVHWSENDPCFIRTDDYYHNGDAIMKAMVEEDKVVYPAEEASSMVEFFTSHFQMWSKRAYVHWGVGLGLEEGECSPEAVLEKLGELFANEEKTLPRLGDAPPADGVATLAVLGTGKQPVFLTFSEQTADKLNEITEGAVDTKVVTEDIFDRFKGDDDDEVTTWMENAHAVLVAAPSDLVGSSDGPCRFVRFMNDYRERCPEETLCTLLIDEDIEAFKSNLWLVNVVHQLIENADMAIFASYNEAADVVKFFTKTKYPESAVARMSCFQLIPFPRLHFYTLGTAIGAELEDGEIFLPAVTVGPGAGNEALPAAEKFKKDSPFIYQGFANHERVIPGPDDSAGVSLIMPSKLLCSIFSGVCDNLAAKCGDELTWDAAFEGDFSGRDNMELVEAESNVRDLVSEFTQYLECGAE